MKTCPYCFEQIPVGAVVCRSCTRPYLKDTSQILFLGRVYVIGREVNAGYAIWNGLTGGGPTAHYPGDDKGWAKAYKEYAAAEREAASSSGGGWMVGGFIEF